jgi:hypothetical protein
MATPTSSSSCSDDQSQGKSNLDLDLLNQMLDQCRLGPTKPWPNYIHQDPRVKNGKVLLMATLEACPLPIGSRLIPFPMHKVSLSNQAYKDALFNRAIGTASSHPLIGVFPIVLPIIPALLTGKVSTFFTHGMKLQQERYCQIFDKLYADAPDKEAFLSSEKAIKLRYEHQDLGRRLRHQLRSEREYIVESWEPIQSTISIFHFYTRIIDIVRQNRGFVSLADPQEYARYTALISEADATLIEGDKKLLENFPDQFKVFDNLIRQLKKTNSLLQDPFVLFEQIRGFFSDDVSFEESCAELIRYFTLGILKNMETWILTVCEIVPECHSGLFLTSQPLPVSSDVTPALRKQMEEQLDLIHKVRKDAMSDIWQNNQVKSFCLLPGKVHKTADHCLFFLETLRAVARVKTTYESIMVTAQRLRSVLLRETPPDLYTTHVPAIMKWYPDPDSRHQPLDVFTNHAPTAYTIPFFSNRDME